MLEQLKKLQHVISKRSTNPEYSFFRIADRTIQAYNGTVTLSLPIDLDLTCSPKAETLLGVLKECDSNDLRITLTDANYLSIISGKFKALIECYDEPLPLIKSTIASVDYDQLEPDTIKPIFKLLYPFIGVAKKGQAQWHESLYIENSVFMATNNSALIQYYDNDYELNLDANLPRKFVQEVNRIKEHPNTLERDDKSVTFFYESGAWIRTELYTPLIWPNAVTKQAYTFLDHFLEVDSADNQLITDQFFEGLLTIKPFLDSAKRVHFKANKMQAGIGLEHNAEFRLSDINTTGVYKFTDLMLLKTVNNPMINFSEVVNVEKAYFEGDNVTGCITVMTE